MQTTKYVIMWIDLLLLLNCKGVSVFEVHRGLNGKDIRVDETAAVHHLKAEEMQVLIH